MNSVSMFIFLLCFLIFFVVQDKHFLMTLLIIETLMILFLFESLTKFALLNFYLFLVFIVLSACEGALGLSILVGASRVYSSDFLLMFNLTN